MKNISPTVLPTFRGLSLEDPDQFLFEFKLLCRTYDYEHDNQKLKLFPSTLKEETKWRKKDDIPYLERLEIKTSKIESKLVKELKRLNISIPILQAIKEVPKLNKLVK